MFVLNLLLSVLSIQHSSAQIIDGYANRLSAFPGDSIDLYLNADKPSHAHLLKLYDLAGNEVHSIVTSVYPQKPSGDRPFETGFGYKITKRLSVPALPSGVYLWENKIPFIIRSRDARITVVYSSNTVNAYSDSGGKSLYAFNSSEKSPAQKVSFLRPLPLPRHSEAFLRWLVRQGYEGVGYITDLDLDNYDNFRKSKLIIIAGHSEYWTLQARKNFDRFVHAGKNALILSGNTMWWQVRYNKSKDQLLCFRDEISDPIKSPKSKTINWCEPSLQYPIYTSTGTDFRNAGYGLKADNGWDGYRIVSNSPLLEGTGFLTGDILKCPSDELDGTPILDLGDDIPVIDYQRLSFEKIELIGYDLVSRGGKQGVATWIVFRPLPAGGIVINTASTDWCSSRGIGSNEAIRIITHNMIHKLTNDENVFSTDHPAGLAH